MNLAEIKQTSISSFLDKEELLKIRSGENLIIDCRIDAKKFFLAIRKMKPSNFQKLIIQFINN